MIQRRLAYAEEHQKSGGGGVVSGHPAQYADGNEDYGTITSQLTVSSMRSHDRQHQNRTPTSNDITASSKASSVGNILLPTYVTPTLY